MKNFNRALIWLTASEIIFNIAGYVIHASLGRILGPEDYGRFGIIITLTTMLIVLIGNGIPTAMSKYLAEIFESHPNRVRSIKKTAIKLQVFIILPTTLIFYLLSPFIAETVLRDPSLTPLFQLSAFIIPAFAAASFYFYFYTGLHYFRLQAVLKTLRALARIIFIIGFGYLYGVAGAVAGYIAAPLTIFLIASLYDLFRVSPTLPAKESTYTFPAKQLLNYAWPFTLFLLCYELILTVDLYFVKALLHDDFLTGLYNAAITAGRIPYFLFYALTIILLPAIAKSKTNTTDAETKSLVMQSLRLMVIILIPMLTLLYAYGAEVLQFFYGSRYAGALAAYQIFLIGSGFLTVFYVFAFALAGAGRLALPLIATIFGVVMTSILNFILIPTYGIAGAATAVTLTSLLLMLYILIALVKEFAIKLPVRDFFISLLSSVIIFDLAFFLPKNVFVFIPFGVAFFALHLTFLWYAKVLTPKDLGPFAKMLKKS